ncbi:histidine phosphatase family protein [Streptococcus anginosus]|uniref:histidine phosphatase family protein n=1 Tax=Streptococcus anginosus TaxID=1328 RepID=UPI00066BD3E1|nr:histidine phosphatase family protein [Streptococcus anginosus]MCW0996958.1 histidine phosphatase family protein [Streptococcus anginosus]
MNNTYYFVRHAHSIYSPDEWNRPLSQKGQASLSQLNMLESKPISAIYSSPYKRAIETIEPLAQTLGLSIQLDKRLIERKLSNQSISDQAFEATLKQLWKNPAISLPGGESNLTAQKRALSFLQELEEKHQNEHIIISSHGNLICILLNYFDDAIQYSFWKQLLIPAILILKDEKVYLQ